MVGGAHILVDSKEVRVTAKRTVKFRYRLPGAAVLPVTVEQTIEWTVRHLPPAERKGKAWLIGAWEEPY